MRITGVAFVGLLLVCMIPAGGATSSNETFLLTPDNTLVLSGNDVAAGKVRVALNIGAPVVGDGSEYAYFETTLSESAKGFLPVLSEFDLEADAPVVLAPGAASTVTGCGLEAFVGGLDAAGDLIAYYFFCFNGPPGGVILPGTTHYQVDWTSLDLTPMDIPAGGAIYTSLWQVSSSTDASSHLMLLVGGSSAATLEVSGTHETPAPAPQPPASGASSSSSAPSSAPASSSSSSPSAGPSQGPTSTASSGPSPTASSTPSSSTTEGPKAKGSPGTPTILVVGALVAVAAGRRSRT